MPKDKGVNRRDFLRIGGLATVSLPAITAIGTIGGQEVLASSGTYGGFVARIHDRENSPYQVDDSVYRRFNAKNAIFSRMIWDDEFIRRLNNIEKAYKPNSPGYKHIDVALYSASHFLAGYDGTNSPLMGPHVGILGLGAPLLEPPFGPEFDDPWDPNNHSPEEVAKIVKKAALFLGASLVGIAPMDDRWIYSASYDMMAGESAPIAFSKVEKVALPKGQVSKQEAGELIKAEMSKMSGEQIRAMILEVLGSIDPDSLPPNAPPLGLVKMVPGSLLKKKQSMVSTLPTSILQGFAKYLKMNFKIAVVDPGESAKPSYLEDGTLTIPETMKSVIILAFEMDYTSMEAAPSSMGDICTGDGYSKMAITAGALAQFIRKLGYNAIPCGNNTGISVPQAIDAGLGEAGRHGLLITPKYGPRVRLAKVITDLPMAHDKPISFGVKEFCGICKKCARECPSQAISYEAQNDKPTTISTNPGVMKWAVHAEKCFFGWQSTGSGCGLCIRVCPFNKPDGWIHEATRILIGAKSGSMDNLLVKLDDASGYGPSKPKTHFWEKDSYIHIKS